MVPRKADALVTRIREADVPRSQELSIACARHLAPWPKFCLYGIFYCFAALVVAGGFSVLIRYLIPTITGPPTPDWTDDLVNTVSWAVFAISWWPFALWVRRCRPEFVSLVSKGVLVPAKAVRLRWIPIHPRGLLGRGSHGRDRIEWVILACEVDGKTQRYKWGRAPSWYHELNVDNGLTLLVAPQLRRGAVLTPDGLLEPARRR